MSPRLELTRADITLDVDAGRGSPHRGEATRRRLAETRAVIAGTRSVGITEPDGAHRDGLVG